MPVSKCSAKGRERSQRASSAPRADHRRQARGGVVADLGAGLEAVEHIDPRVVSERRARPRALADMGDEEDAAAGAPQSGRGVLDADPVGVGLDDGAAGGGRDFARQAFANCRRARRDRWSDVRAGSNR